MPYPTGLDSPLGSSRFRNSDPPTTDSVFSMYREPPKPSNPRTSSQSNSASSNTLNDARTSLHRRFTTNTLSGFGLQSLGQALDGSNGDSPAYSGDRKKAEYDYLRQKQLQRQSQMDQLNVEKQREDMQLNRLSRELGMNSGFGRQSEPTTPPEYEGIGGFPTSLSRPERFSTSSILTPRSSYQSQRSSRPESQLTSPPSERARAYEALTSGGSGTQTQNHSDEEDDLQSSFPIQKNRSATALNRNSLPVTRRDLGNSKAAFPPTSASPNLGLVDTTTFLFRDDEESHSASTTQPSSAPRSNRNSSYLQLNENDDQFPVLIRRDESNPSRYSGSMEMSSPDKSKKSAMSNNWRRAGNRQTLPSDFHMSLGSAVLNDNEPGNQAQTSGQSTPHRNANRRSLGAQFMGGGRYEYSPDEYVTSPSAESAGGDQPKLQSSFSTNDLPASGATVGHSGSGNNLPESSIYDHNSNMGRVATAGVIGSNRTSREYNAEAYQQALTAYQDAAEGYSVSANAGISPQFQTTDEHAANAVRLTEQGLYESMMIQNQIQMLNSAMNHLKVQQGMPGQNVYKANMPAPTNVQIPPTGYPQYQAAPPPRATDTQARPTTRRATNEDPSRFVGVSLYSFLGEIFELCKDQHGCRFLQRKLEENDPEQIEAIFAETKDHMVELMTDPFGNYLVQKLLEYTEPSHHTVLINNASTQMVKIALNQHGTRALQKMIEYVRLNNQIQTVILALKDQVVSMIQDLNGNHVIQKCLNRLSYLASEHAQFIFDAVSINVIAVGTHRHGCCVIQRCLDHASVDQKAQLMTSIIENAFPLVQDPFGNYVLQYIFDQNDGNFNKRLCHAFRGSIIMLSKQKFSSNVIEKCIKNADMETRSNMINEIVSSPDFDRVVEDAFANYVLQTALENAEADDEARLADRIRPLVPRIRHKQWCRKLSQKIAERDRRMGIEPSGTMTPVEFGSPESGSPAGGHNYNQPRHFRANSSAGSHANYGHANTFASPFVAPQITPNMGSAAEYLANFNHPRRYTNPGQFQNNSQFPPVGGQFAPGYPFNYPRGPFNGNIPYDTNNNGHNAGNTGRNGNGGRGNGRNNGHNQRDGPDYR